MSLKLGSLTTVVVSSAEVAKIVFQKHDLAISDRFIQSSIHHVKHDEFSVAWLPVENQWRKLRKICKEQMFSVSRLDASQGLRREKLQKLCDYLKECSEAGQAVDIGDAAFTTSLNLISATLFSMEFAQFNSDSSQEMKDVVWGVMKCIGSPNLADYFPVLKSIDPQGISKKMEIHFKKLFAIFQESDISQFPYLQAVVKETFRFHPVVPFLVPRKAESNVEVNGYIVPRDAQILVNVWASGRDPNIWTNADSFEPERFLNGNGHIDYRGNNFELIPFEAGRRICLELPLAYRMVHLMLTSLIRNFDWKLEGIKLEELDMDERFGLGVQETTPLNAVPTKLS